MRRPLFAAVLALSAAVAVPAAFPSAAHAQDFDPNGRGGHKKPPHANGGGKPNPNGGTKKPPRHGDDDDNGPKGPSVEEKIQRYSAAALAQPAAPFPVQKLAELYRSRDGNLKKLTEDFENRAKGTGPDAWNAKVVLAGVYKQDGRFDDAIKTYEAAIVEKPKDPAAIQALAALQADKGDKTAARANYEKVLPLVKGQDLEQTTRTLMLLDLDLKDYAGAKAHHAALMKAVGSNSLFVKAELGRELLSRGVYDKAEDEFREVVKAASGDNRVLAPALRDLGSALAKQKKMPEAMATLKKALAVAGSAAGVRNEILLIMTEAYRADGKLPELITILESEGGRDAQRLATIGSLYEETGEVDKAIATYKKALSADSKLIDTRLKLVHLYQTAGELDTAIKEYEQLIKSAPGNPDFVFELCETLIQRGDRPKALKLVQDLEGRAKDEDVLAAIADFYERVEEKDKALKVLQRLAGTSGGDPSHLIDLGDRYFQAGDKKKALETWARIKTIITNKAKASATLGDVYLDHDMPVEALQALKDAVSLEPNNVRYKKSLATALERTATTLGNPTLRYAEARQIWEELLGKEGLKDVNVAREARQHIVSLWSLTRELAAQVTPLSNKFNATPPDLEAGRLLAEVEKKLHRLPEAEATLRKIVSVAPGDEESLLSLERTLVLEQNLLGAIDVLSKLTEVDPKRAREFYQRMAQYAAELYRDDDAIKYAARAVELSPDDANGHEKLGDMYKRRQDIPHAIAEYRAAITKNDRLFLVYCSLAELLLSTGQADEADRLFRRVVRSSPDEELVTRAANWSMQINLGKNSLDVLERELLPVAVGNPQKPIYRRLLVKVYDNMTFPLRQRVKNGDPNSEAAQKAREELAKIGSRAVKPLLDALADDKESQQQTAIEVLAYVQNKSAGASLYNFATGNADKSLRVRAMIACGALKDPSMLPKFEAMLAPKEGSTSVVPSDSIAVAAAWGVARMGDKKAEPLLVKLLGSAAPDVRALAAVGLGLSHDKKYAPLLAGLAKAPEAGPMARAAAAYGLGELGVSPDPGLFLALAEANDTVLRQSALLTLSRLASKEDATRANGPAEAIASGVFSPDEQLRAAAATAAAALATHTYKRTREPLPVPDGELKIREVLQQLGPDPFGANDRATALITLAPALQKAAIAAVSTSPDRARIVADALLAKEDKPTFLPFVDGNEKLDAAKTKLVNDAIEKLAASVVSGFVALERHPAIDVRTRAVELLARRSEPEAQRAVIDALDDPEESVRRAALSALGPVKDPATIKAVAALSKDSPSWPLRVRATEALGRLGAGGASASVVDALKAAAQNDGYALVRERALRALYSVDKAAATPILTSLSKNDPEPHVRAAAEELLASGTKK